MDARNHSEDAARALEDIGRRQEAVIDRISVPAWFWWLVGIGAVAVGAAADTAQPATIVLVALAFAFVVAGVTVSMVVGTYSGVRIRSDLLGPAGATAIVGFVMLIVAATLGLAFTLRALGFGYPGTASTAACALLLIVGGPRLMARLRGVMLANRQAGR